MPTARIEEGSIHYAEAGPADGPVVVGVHGFLMAGDVWSGLALRLADRGIRFVMPTWPMGAHHEPMDPRADLAPRGMARVIAHFLEALDLRDVTLIGNDSGGAVCQVVAAEHPERLGGLVLTDCDAFENFPPPSFKPLVQIAKLPGGLRAALAPLRFAAFRRSSRGYGLMSHGDIDHLAREWVKPALADPRVRADVRKFTVGMDPSVTLDAAAKLSAFDKPVLLAWATDDKLFEISWAERLAAVLTDARVQRISGSRTFVMVDQPDQLAGLVAEHVLRQSELRDHTQVV